MSKDFNTVQTEVIEFTVDGEKYTALPASKLPSGTVIKYLNESTGSPIESLLEFLTVVLDEDSAERFQARVDGETDNPIPFGLLAEIAGWIVGEYFKSEEEAKPAPKPRARRK